RIFGEAVPVGARVETINGLSAHADRTETLRWLTGFTRPPRQTYLVHGEPPEAQALKVAIEQRFGWSVQPAGDGETVSIT
ncbi:MAG TPA: MBL fold metallo-hydrolase RNA specificity domain-containing protein, partial [Gemmatimonadales bacterium]|nr:MBL fold metallo-hydrolase RNA specificity domain-containing protein [Gemmatimonadales bacterium]